MALAKKERTYHTPSTHCRGTAVKSFRDAGQVAPTRGQCRDKEEDRAWRRGVLSPCAGDLCWRGSEAATEEERGGDRGRARQDEG